MSYYLWRRGKRNSQSKVTGEQPAESGWGGSLLQIKGSQGIITRGAEAWMSDTGAALEAAQPWHNWPCWLRAPG